MLPRRAGGLLLCVVTASLVASVATGCSGSDDLSAGSDAAPTTSEPDPVPSTLDDPAFDPDVVDEGLVPETVDEVVLDDDVIIATEDGQIPTTTTEPPPGGDDARPPADPPDGAITSPPLPPPSAIRDVVSLSPTHTDTIDALGLAGLLVGVDPDSDVPDGAPIVRDQVLTDDLDTADLRSLGVDLVVIGDDPGDIAARDLADAGIPFFDGARPTDRAGVERQILDLATTLGRLEAGRELVDRMRADAEAVLAAVPPTSGLTYFHEYDPGYATYAAGTLVDSLYGELGLTPIVPADDEEDIIFFSSERLLAADPDVIVLGDVDCCAATVERAAARPGWSGLTAVENGAIVEVPDDIANRWGTGIVDLLRLVAGGVAAAAG